MSTDPATHFADCILRTVTPHPHPLPRHPFPLEMSIVLGLILGWGGGAFALPGRDTVSFDFGWKVSIIHFVLFVGLSQCEWDGVGAQCCFFHTPVHLPLVHLHPVHTFSHHHPGMGGCHAVNDTHSPTNPLTHSLTPLCCCLRIHWYNVCFACTIVSFFS